VNTLDEVLDQLDRWHQRATYGAVAGVAGARPQSVMHGRARSPRGCWVVNARTKRPTGYSDDELHQAFDEQPHVIATAEELSGWLADHRGPRRAPRPTADAGAMASRDA
jgi:hypothetical protein